MWISLNLGYQNRINLIGIRSWVIYGRSCAMLNIFFEMERLQIEKAAQDNLQA